MWMAEILGNNLQIKPAKARVRPKQTKTWHEPAPVATKELLKGTMFFHAKTHLPMTKTEVEMILADPKSVPDSDDEEDLDAWKVHPLDCRLSSFDKLSVWSQQHHTFFVLQQACVPFCQDSSVWNAHADLMQTWDRMTSVYTTSEPFLSGFELSMFA